ncbi:MAG: large protein [Bacteroidetes bacterium]|jgi:hypothetical protein|nr:large protein [Bacteroidota bacterium]
MKKILLLTLSLVFINCFNAAVFAQAPTTAASNVITVGKTTTSISINWTSGNGSKRIVTIALASSSVSLPVTGGTYTANSGFGSGSHLGNGNYCIYNGTSYGCNAFSLSPNTSYKIRVFEYNTVSTTEYYLTSSYPVYTEYTLDTEPVTAASSLAVSNIQTNSASLSFTSGSGTYDLVALRQASSYANVPVDATNYGAASAYGSGSTITGTSPYPYVMSDGTSTFIGTTSLSAGTTYTAAVFPFNGANSTINYKTTGYPTATFTTLASQPTNAAYNMYFTNVTDNSMTVSWTIPSGGGSYHIVTCKPGTVNSDVPTDATAYTANANYGSGSQIGGGSGAYVVYNGMNNYVSVTGLSNSTDYTFSVYEYNVASNTYNLTYNYLTTSYLTGTGQTLLSEPTVAPSALTFSNITSNSVKATWANGNGNKRIVGVAAGRKPTALAFDGVNDHVAIPNESVFDFNTQMTVEAWIKVNSFSMYDQSVITKGSDSWMITRNGNTNSLKFTLTSNDFFFGPTAYSAGGSRSVNDGKWHHVAATYDGSQMILYIDGTLDAYTYMYNDIINNSAAVHIGGNAVASGNNFNGQIDEVRIWNIPQSYGTIRTNMNKTLIGNENGLKGYWKLDDGYTSSTTALNSSFTSGLDGALVNFNSTSTASNFTNTSGWIHSGATVNVPLDFSFYLDNTAFMSGTAASYYYGNLFYNVYKGPDSTSITVTGFSPNTYYTFEVFDYNGTTLTNNNYLTSNYAVGEVLTSPVTAPTLTSFTPAFGYVGSVVTINGTGFNTVASSNTVYLGAAKATVLTANAGGTQLTVKVPYGASYERISVTNNMLTAYSTKPFVVTSPCGSVDFTTSTLDAGVSAAGYFPSEMRIVDMDSDGLPDVLGVYYYGYMTISRNTSTTTAVNLNNLYFITTGYVYSGDMEVGDLDGDGRTDVVLGNNYASGAGLVAVRNTSTPGSLNTPAIVEFAGYPGVDVSDVAVADLDKDGKPDVIMSYTNNVVSYFRNTSSIGNISFAPRTDVTLGAISVINSIAVGDIDGDGKMDIAAAGGSGSQINYMRNTSVAGTISFATFTTTSLSGTITGIAIGDIDNDTKPEILYGNGTSNIGILKNNSSTGTINISAGPVFLTTLANTPSDIKLADIDGDGKLDIAVGYNGGTEISIYKNTSTASIIIDAGVNFTVAGGAGSPASVAICDMNSDTKADILSTTDGQNFSFFQNAINPLGAEPTVQATGLTFSGVSTSQITCNFTPGNGANKVIFVRAASSPAYAPTDGVGYVPNTTFGTGTHIGGGNYCVFDGNSNSVTVTGLLPNTSYVFSVYEYNGVQNCQFNYMPGTTSNSAAQMTLNNAPTLTAISNPSAVCQNSGLQTVNLTGIGTGSANETQTLVITATSSNTGLIPNPTVVYSSPAATGSLTYTPVAGISGTALITVTVNDGATNNNTIVRTFTVTVNHTPTTSVAGPDQQVCPSIATLAANAPSFGTGIWMINYSSNPAITITDVNDPTSTIYGFNIGDSVRLRWEISSGVCPVSGSFVSVKRKSCPTTADFTASSTVECLNGTPAVTFTDASISAGSTVNAWSWSFGAGASPPTANTQGPHTVLYSTAGPKHVSLTVTDLLSVSDNETKFSFVNITDVPDPATNVSGSASVCQGQNSVNYTVPSILNATGYTWNLPSGAVLISGVNTNSIMVNFGASAVSGNISVRGTNACGNGALSANFPVTVNPLPSSAGTIATTTSNICDGASGIVFTVPAITNATSYSWSLPGGATIIGATNTNSITVNFTQGLAGGTISVNGVNSCGNGVSSSMNFVINPYPGIADAILGQTAITNCPSTSGVTYSIPLVSNAVSYNWTVPSGASITSGAGTNSITVNYSALAVSGIVTVTPVNSCGNGTASNLSITVNTLPEMAGNISGNDTINVCPVSNSVNYSVSPVFNASHYVWSIPSGATIVSGDSTNSIVVNYDNTSVSGSVSVYAENACGTGASSSLNVFVTAVPMQELCMVTVDNNSNFNNVTWEKPVAMDIDSFRIYREVLSSFVHIASVHYDSLSSYVDSVFLPVADPNTTNFRYKVSVIDTCGNESVLSNHHRTIFLQANQGVGGVVNLNWVPYEGAAVDFYRILRDTLGSGSFVAIDSVPGSNTVFTDLNPPATSTNIRYVLESNWSTSCTPTRATVNTTRSNIKGVNLIITGEIEQTIMNAAINVYPNPADELITIEYPGGFKKYSLQLFDALGQMVINEELSGMVSANTNLTHQLDVSALTKGVYIVNLQTEYGSTFKRIVIQ